MTHIVWNTLNSQPSTADDCTGHGQCIRLSNIRRILTDHIVQSDDRGVGVLHDRYEPLTYASVPLSSVQSLTSSYIRKSLYTHLSEEPWFQTRCSL